MNRTGRRTPATPEGVTEHPVCECHGEKMLWQNHSEMRAGGNWYCRIRRVEYNARRRAQRVQWAVDKRAQHPEMRDMQIIYQRRSTLRAMRRHTLDQLAQLRQEAEDLGAEPRPQEPTETESDPPRRVLAQTAARTDRLGRRRAAPRSDGVRREGEAAGAAVRDDHRGYLREA